MIDILGIDCATDPRNTGIAHATLEVGSHGAAAGSGGGGTAGPAGGPETRGPDTSKPVLRYLASGTAATSTAETLAGLLTPGRPALIGLDAPLGWPAAMGRVLSGHRAGESVGLPANELFRRHTDRVVRERIGKQPLDVGADRIARTAVAALDLLAELRRLTGRALPVATRGTPPAPPVPATRPASAPPGDASGTAEGPLTPDAALEVYPAGRLIALRGEGYRRGYRGSGQAAEDIRRAMLRDLEAEVRYEADAESAVADVDLLDAIICVCAVVDVLRGHCTPPEALGLPLDEIDREGWIWLPLSLPRGGS
ncbi:MAG: DUF429 domain-containing protein [Spirochaetes bacterium]|jgi:hypothetical protein|nr:DUF429 domain-containing protein [Spirochaetota bacterium]